MSYGDLVPVLHLDEPTSSSPILLKHTTNLPWAHSELLASFCTPFWCVPRFPRGLLPNPTPQWTCAVVLLGLTAYRIHYTKGLDNGDILTSSSHFYGVSCSVCSGAFVLNFRSDGIIVELLVTSCLTILGSMVM